MGCMDIIELKEIVKERGIHATARTVFPNKDLALWKVRMTMVGDMPTARVALLQVGLEPPRR